MKKMKLWVALCCVMVLLLLAGGCACEHEFGQWTVKTAPTCTAEGVEERACTKCDETEERPVAVIAHSYGAWTVTKTATCAATGTETSTCNNCGEKQEREVAKLAHTYGDWSTVQESTCVTTGKKEHICSGCGAKEEAVLELAAHTWNEATCVQAKTCKVCQATDGTMGSHKYNKGKCTLCGEADPRYTEIAKALKAMERYPKYISINKDLIENYYKQYKLTSKPSLFTDAHKRVLEIHDYLDKMMSLCGDYKELATLKKECEEVKLKMPIVPTSASSSDMRSYILKAKTYATQADRVSVVYNVWCKSYGVS